MKVGDVIKFKAKYDSDDYSEERSAVIYQIYSTFVVLDTGKYKICAYISDIERKIKIAM